MIIFYFYNIEYKNKPYGVLVIGQQQMNGMHFVRSK